MNLVKNWNRFGTADISPIGLGQIITIIMAFCALLTITACDYGPEDISDEENTEAQDLKKAQTWGGINEFGLDEPWPYYDCAWATTGCNFVSYNSATFCGDVSPISATKVTINYAPKLKIKLNWCIDSYDAACDSGKFRLPADGKIGTVRYYSGSNLVYTGNITNVSLILSSPYDYGYAYVETAGKTFDRVAISINAGTSHTSSQTGSYTTTFGTSSK